jgi:non-ribosomal peptide synthetase component F
MINGYGPTEATVAATMNKSGEWEGNPSIGKPIANAQVYILDGEMNPVPVKVKGELCIGGVGLARCYNNRADLMAERFLPDRFSTAL